VTTDSAPEKWTYREHTRVKHILLEKYLEPWIKILGRRHTRICYVDGFAGRGEYVDGTLGSPLKALRVADGLSDHYRHMLFVFIEKNRDNFDNLQQREKTTIRNLHKMTIEAYNREFAVVMQDVADRLQHDGTILVPLFFFIDPFGFAGIPFNIVTTILANPRTEVFFTFMVRDIERFLAHPDLVETFTMLFGTDEWRNVKDLPQRELALMELYTKQLHEACGVEFTFSFRVSESDKLRTLYYLIHATNNFTGHKIMKGIMFNESPDGSFAYLGPNDVSRRYQGTLFDIHDIEQLKDVLLERLAGQEIRYDDIEKAMCVPWHSEPPYVDKHYRKALKELEKENRTSVIRVTSKTDRGLSGQDRIAFPQENHVEIALPLMDAQPKESPPKARVHFKKFPLLDGTSRLLVSRVGDGSIITRFDKTPKPGSETDVVCPHFLELKWAYGCPFDCAWCYLKGTFRFRPDGPAPVVKPYVKTEAHVRSFLEEVDSPEILNSGEIADSLMTEATEQPFSKFIIPLFQTQSLHKVLLLTKSSSVENLLEIDRHTQAIISFSLNAVPVAERWEVAPHVRKRIEAARRVSDAGYEVRLRIDPMVPVQGWAEHYSELLGMVFDHFTPERITLGSLRGLQSTINSCADKTWVGYLKESSNWGKKIDFKTRIAMYSAVIDELATKHDFHRVALCKETVQAWKNLGMDYKQIRCNCIT